MLSVTDGPLARFTVAVMPPVVGAPVIPVILLKQPEWGLLVFSSVEPLACQVKDSFPPAGAPGNCPLFL
jgi:hypothetical protein